MVNFEQIYYLSRYLSGIEHKILHLQTSSNGILLTALFFDNKKEEMKVKLQFYERIKPIIDELNSMISIFNKHKNKYFFYLRSPDLKKIDKRIFKIAIYEHKDNSGIGRKYTVLKLSACLISLMNSIQNFHECFSNLYLPFGGAKRSLKARQKIKANLSDAVQIYSIGSYGSAVFVVGKVLEQSITDYLLSLKIKRLIHYTTKEIISCPYDTKIEILKKEGLISLSQYSKIMSVKWDRNIFGHPTKPSEIKHAQQDADGIIKIGINMIELIEQKLSKIRAHGGHSN